MDKNMDFQGFGPYDNMNFEPGFNDPVFNPMMQYEQGYMYYRYMCMQLEYKMKSKEYEKLCARESRAERKIE